ncbi:MAG: GlsB/YeaQ/YmgE family stress response membrane protein [Candidatus Dormibacteria bacterium]|jgi:uncharacterized membrane protein YeaQ/YmgE (transglycosylase-associated protein family)|nr:GlsB/YeaQ/YmgE family stress response membrane protein [Chloroflexota bacterium]HBV93394.1 GlsB/YeaQ/YmgE family stress response membrane protein [Chloroflexota bacterium]
MLGIVTITLDPVELLVWALIGLVVGFLATRVMLGHGLGVGADIVVGLVGAVAGGFLAQLFGVTLDIPGHPYISEGVIAFLGAVVLLAVMRMLGVGGHRGVLRR